MLGNASLDGERERISCSSPEQIEKVPTSLRKCVAEALPDQITQQRDHIEERRLPARVGADQHVERAELLLHVAQAAVVESFDLGNQARLLSSYVT